MNSVKEIEIENCTYYFLEDMINMKNLNLNKIKIQEKSCRNIFMYYIEYVTTNSAAKPLYFIMNKNRYIEEGNGNKYLTLVPSDKSKVWGTKSEILLDQLLRTSLIVSLIACINQTIMIKIYINQI